MEMHSDATENADPPIEPVIVDLTNPTVPLPIKPIDPYSSPAFINAIKKSVTTSYISDINMNLSSKSRLKLMADVSETLSHVCTGFSAIFAFAAGAFNYPILSFVAGCFGTMSLLLSRFSSYAMSESSERTTQVNKLLNAIGFKSIPDISINSTLINVNSDTED